MAGNPGGQIRKWEDKPREMLILIAWEIQGPVADPREMKKEKEPSEILRRGAKGDMKSLFVGNNLIALDAVQKRLPSLLLFIVWCADSGVKEE